ncbi:MAG TPA: phospholipase D-like domain-containing protein [Candidatus Thermoplasmatota archaeon]|nr:phospholipase D-like domain-containing protein [Candidatus Thermoplasmatota archaeon]
MRALVLAMILLAPTASAAWSARIDAPSEADEGLPFPIAVCAEADGRGQVRVLAANATLDVREDRYQPAFEGSACRAFNATPTGGPVSIEARVRRDGGSAIEARAHAAVRILGHPLSLSSSSSSSSFVRFPALPIPVVGEVVAFATPDAGAAPVVALLDEARREVLVEAYTLTSPDIAAALARAADRGANVTVLLEGAPVGGVPPEERALVAALEARGARVLALGGEGARYRTVHSKAFVVDGGAVAVATENFHDASSRGYGLVVRNASLARQLAQVISFDVAGFDVKPFDARAEPGELVPFVASSSPPAPSPFEGNVTLIVSPDDPLAVARLVANATQSVDVEMLRAEPHSPLVDALVEAARGGARVRLLLDGRHDDGANRETVARLAALAEREGLAIEARRDRPDRTLHAKAVAVDGRAVYVGSMNWVRAAVEDNREVGLLVEDAVLTRWLEKEMEKDWRGPEPEVHSLPAPPAGACLALMITSRLRRASRRA